MIINNSNGDEEEDQVLRRVFSLCFLNTIPHATHRIVLNPQRSNESVTAQDYTITDYNYVSIKRKHQFLIQQAIAGQPGSTLTVPYITGLIEGWANRQSDVSLPSYTLDSVKGRLVKDPASTFEKRPLVLIDQCPRTGNPRISFLLSFLKARIPDLLGDTKVENLLGPVLASPFTCFACFDAVRDTLFLPCCHLLLCTACHETLRPVECLVCRNNVVEVKRIYLS